MIKTTAPKKIVYPQIGIIHSLFTQTTGVPIQPSAAKSIKGKITVFSEYVKGLSDLDGFSHIILFYHFHLSKDCNLKVISYIDEKLRGVFASRAPARLKAISILLVRLIKIRSNILFIDNVEIVDGAPLLSIKPEVPEFDRFKIQKSTGYKTIFPN